MVTNSHHNMRSREIDLLHFIGLRMRYKFLLPILSMVRVSCMKYDWYKVPTYISYLGNLIICNLFVLVGNKTSYSCKKIMTFMLFLLSLCILFLVNQVSSSIVNQNNSISSNEVHRRLQFDGK